MSIIIEAHQISKKYRLGTQGVSYSTLVEMLAKKGYHLLQTIKNPFASTRSHASKQSEEFWALHPFDLNIHEGDRVGILGGNGAGKSTLLKILSRITEPTTGQIKIKGRISSLLEVGTGFHPELTGRENIFLNGAILGMKRQEIKQKFDEIVAFSEIEKFLDTPVKRYSSGMYMRLGFAIAAHLDSELLIIDEVLAVGDVRFQQKCIKKLNALNQTGRTLLYVSHDIASILGLCNKGIVLEKGRLKAQGSIEECVNSYMQTVHQTGLSWSGNEGDENIRVYHASLHLKEQRQFFYPNDEITLEIDYEVLKAIPNLVIGVSIWDSRNQRLARSETWDSPEYAALVQPGKKKAKVNIHAHLFYEGEYQLKVHAFIHNVKKILDSEISLKFPIYTKRENTILGSHVDKSGINLNYIWSLN